MDKCYKMAVRVLPVTTNQKYKNRYVFLLWIVLKLVYQSWPLVYLIIFLYKNHSNSAISDFYLH